MNSDGSANVLVNSNGSVDRAVNTIGPVQTQILAAQAQTQA